MPAIMARVRTLKDRLSRLTYQEACKLLGEEAAQLIRAGGRCEIDIEGQVHLGDDLFRLKLAGSVVTITLMAEARQRLRWNCTRHDAACECVGAALALILEEKTALGLAAPPPEREPVQSLKEEDLVRAALSEREERARTEKMTVKPADPGRVWTDYMVTNRQSGKSYRVALRGTEPGTSYCSCPDFRKNTLGTCKHIIRTVAYARKRFSGSALRRPSPQKEFAVHLQYGRDLDLRLLVPAKLDSQAQTIIRPIRDRSIDDLPDLLRRIQRLGALGHDVIVYPDAEEYIQQQLAAMHLTSVATEIRRNPTKHPLRRELLKVELLPYQMDGVAFAAGAGRAILADDMGLGKTIQGIGVAELLAREAGISRVLVVCPASLKSQWRNEIERFCDRDCQLVSGSARERAEQYHNDCFFTICNYEQVLRDILPIENAKWDLIVLDEGQRIKNWEAKTSRVIKSLRSRFALVLSGTPLENRLDDLFSVAEFIDDRRLGPAFRFFNHHRMVDDKGKVLGFKNLTDLRKRLRPVLLRRTRGSVMKDLPPRSTEIVRIHPTDEQYEIHQSNMQIVRSIVRKPFISEMDLLRLRKALMLCRMSADGTALVDKQKPGYSSKLEHLDGLLDQLCQESDRKIVLFSEWTTMLDMIEPLLSRRGIDFVRLDGSVPQKKRQPLVNRFQKVPECRVFITTNAGSTGLNLQAANTVINVDLPWNPAVLEQRIARAHRMGQKNPVQVFVLVTTGTIEESLLATLSAKHELALAALDADSEVDVVGLASGMEELKSRLEVLLGTPATAPEDASQKEKVAQEMEQLARRERVALAGGQLFTAAIGLLGELAPQQPDSDAVRKTSEEIRSRLGECVESNGNGETRLTLTLPNAGALDGLADALARLLAAGR